MLGTVKEKSNLLRSFPAVIAVSSLGVLPFLSTAVHAADATWTGATSGNSATGSNWSTAATPGTVGSGGSAGTSADIATFSINTNAPVYYTSTSPNDWNLGGIAFTGTPGAITIQSGSTGTGTRRLYFTAGGAGVTMASTVTSTMTFARTGISSGSSGDVLFTNNATDSTALLNMASTFSSAAPSASNLVLGGSNTGLNSMGGAISNTGAALSVVKNGSGTWVLSAANTYTGSTTVNDGVLGVGSSAALGGGMLTLNGGAIASAGATARTLANNITVGGDFSLGGLGQTITLNGTVDLGAATRSITLQNSATVGGVISNGGLTVASASASRSLTLNANNTYGGATLVSSGTLLVNGSLPNSSSVTVSAGATIGGDGAITNALAVDSGAALRIGTSTGDSVVGSLDTGAFALGGTYFATITANGVNDFLNITGNANFTDGTIAPFLSAYSPVLGDAFQLAEWTGGFSGTPAFDYSNAVLDSGLSWDDSTFASDGYLRVAAIPEPASVLLGGLGLIGILRRRRS